MVFVEFGAKMWNIYTFSILTVFTTNLLTVSTGNDYDASGPQYHIQTDEGPERYFRYQTLSGQYRKEKRLEDGTVIGSYGWLDADGFFRLREYIADGKGYRILKTKNVYVGKNASVKDSISAAKKAKDSGEVPKIPIIPEATTSAPEITTIVPLAKYVAVTRRPAISATTEQQYEVFTSRYTGPKSSSYIQYPSYQSRRTGPVSARLKVRPFTSNALDYAPEDLSVQVQNYDNNYAYYDNPIDRNDDYSNNNNYYPDNRYNLDTVSVGSDGFRYYLPRQYHAEQYGQGKRTGSFGYIDPFGIRRVIYYNTGPGTGFQHRKNNRYVGFGATPYDP